MAFVIDASSLNEQFKQRDILTVRALMDDPVTKTQDRRSPPVLPNSIDFDIDGAGSDRLSCLPHMRPAPADLSAMLGKLGVSQTQPLVVYDNRGVFCSPRVWWLLKSLGHHDVTILNGGFPAWVDRELNLKNCNATLPTQHYTPAPQPAWFVDSPDVLNAIESDTQIIDARSPDRFYGREPEPRPGCRGGHMPGAYNIHYKTLLEHNRFKSISALGAVFERAGIDLTQPIITTCGSGITACIVGVAALLLGADDVRVYDGSWVEWGTDPALPVEL